MDHACLVVDIGNSQLHYGFSRSCDVLDHVGHVPHREVKDLGPQVLDLAQGAPLKVLVGSVNPKPMADLRALVKEQLQTTEHVLQFGLNWSPRVATDNPREVGIDRLLNARALRDEALEGAIVVDHGTALTCDYVAPGGVYAGGTILPGSTMMIRSLAEKTSLIPRISYQDPPSVVGTNTADCIRSGVYYGMAGLVDRLIAEIRREKGSSLPVYIAGGNASFFRNTLSGDINYRPNLTLEGLLRAGQDMGLWG